MLILRSPSSLIIKSVRTAYSVIVESCVVLEVYRQIIATLKRWCVLITTAFDQAILFLVMWKVSTPCYFP
jgi:hypothetical protein